MAKTLVDFRAEKGLYLKDLAQTLEMTEDELRTIEESGIVPEEIGQRLILHYSLPADYFAEPVKPHNIKRNPSNPLTYFFGVSLVWGIVRSLVATIPSYISMLATTFFSIASAYGGFMSPAFLTSTPFKLFNSYFPTVVSIVSGVFLVKYIFKHTNYVGEIKKYQFVYPILPDAPVICISRIFGFITQFVMEKSIESSGYEASQNSMFALLGVNSISLVVSIIISVLSSYICAKLLCSAAFDDHEKRKKLLRTIAVFATISYVLSAIIYVVHIAIFDNPNMTMMITNIVGYVLGIVLAWALALVKTENKKSELIVYTILPILVIIL